MYPNSIYFGPKVYRDYFKAKVYTVWVHGPFLSNGKLWYHAVLVVNILPVSWFALPLRRNSIYSGFKVDRYFGASVYILYDYMDPQG